MSTISEDQGDAPGTDPTSTPYTITVNDIFDGLLTMRQEAPTEEDYVRLAMTPGYGYYLTLELPDPEYDHVTMELHDAAGEQIINWAGPWLPYVEHIAASDGTPLFAYVRDYDFASQAYTLALTRETGQGTGTATSLALGETFIDALEYEGDQDWLRVDLTAGHGYVFSAALPEENMEQGEHVRIVLYDSTGTELAGENMDGYRSGLEYVPTEDETIFVSVEQAITGYGPAPVPTADYTLTYWQDLPGSIMIGSAPDRYPGVLMTQAVLGLDQTVQETVDLAPVDIDGVRLDVVENAAYRITITYPESGGPADYAELLLLDAEGLVLAGTRTQDGSNAQELSITFLAEEGEPAYLAIHTQAPSHLGQSYTLQLEQIPHERTGDGSGSDLWEGSTLNDTIIGWGGSDTIIGHAGDDVLIGGPPEDSPSYSADLRDVIYGGDGNDDIDGGYGNDALRGDAGDDTIIGGYGADTLIGGTGNDQLGGGTWGDALFGGDGADFLNGGFGHDQVNGGAGADRFYHLGVEGHGSDWIQDYDATEGDVLQFGGTASAADFQVNVTETANAGTAGVEEAFVIYRPTGQILWALVDGAAQDAVTLVLGGVEYDLTLA